jgi:hypothetical protein
MRGATLQWNASRHSAAADRRGHLDRDTTLALFAVAALLALLARWGDARRRRDPHGRLALLPWHALMFVSLVGLLFLGVHLLSFFGGRN